MSDSKKKAMRRASRVRNGRLLIFLSFALIIAGIVGVLWSCNPLFGAPTNNAISGAMFGMVVWTIVAGAGVVALVVGLAWVSKVRVEVEEEVVQYAATRDTRAGDVIGRMTVVQCGPEAVLLTNQDDMLHNGWIRLVAAIASAIAGAAISYASLAGVIALGPKGWLCGIALLICVPFGLACGFNVNWAASLTAADGEPGMVFERRYLFFVRAFDSIPARNILDLKVGASHHYSSLRVLREGARPRMLASDSPHPEKVGALHALRVATLTAMGRS